MQSKIPTLVLVVQRSIPNSFGPGTFAAVGTSTTHTPDAVHARNRQPELHRRCRQFATINEDYRGARNNSRGDHPGLWPEKPDRHPTPYEIFGLSKDATYSKARFYELVKEYHPDRNNAATQAERELMIERYRMIITAHTILSDPQKRKAYDEFGFGWHEPRTGPSNYRYTTTHRWRSDTTYKTSFEDDPMYNANWEDWERWYQRQWERDRARARGEPYPSSSPFSSSFFTSRHRAGYTVYLSNQVFISLVFLFAALGAIGQATRLDEAAKSRTDRLNLVSEQTSAALMQARQDTKDAAGEDKRDRIRRFVREKEVQGNGEQFDGRVLRPGTDEGICASGAVQTRNEPRFWQKPPENR